MIFAGLALGEDATAKLEGSRDSRRVGTYLCRSVPQQTMIPTACSLTGNLGVEEICLKSFQLIPPLGLQSSGRNWIYASWHEYFSSPDPYHVNG